MSDNSATEGAGPSYREKRSVPRYSLIASVEIVEPISDAHMSGRISEISLKGCYLDILNTLPVGTKIRLTVTRDQGTFITLGRIIYVQEGMGFGVAFLETAPDQVTVLEAWLTELQA